MNEVGPSENVKDRLPRSVEFREPHTLQVGDTVTFSHVFLQEDLDSFTRLSGDINPLHQDDAYAQSLGFSERIVFGLLTTALVSRLVGVHLPGRHSLIRDVQAQFANPLYINQEVNVVGKVDLVDLEKRLLAIKVRITRVEDGAILMRGKVLVTLADPTTDWRVGRRPQTVV